MPSARYMVGRRLQQPLIRKCLCPGAHQERRGDHWSGMKQLWNTSSLPPAVGNLLASRVLLQWDPFIEENIQNDCILCSSQSNGRAMNGGGCCCDGFWRSHGFDYSPFPLSASIQLWTVVENCYRKLLSSWSYDDERDDNAICKVIKMDRQALLIQLKRLEKITVRQALVVHVVREIVLRNALQITNELNGK